MYFVSVGRCSRRQFSRGCRALCDAKQQQQDAGTSKDKFDFQENVQADKDAQTDYRYGFVGLDINVCTHAAKHI